MRCDAIETAAKQDDLRGSAVAGRAAQLLVVRPLHTRMKNVNVFVDVDLTLIDANGKILDWAREALQ